MGTNFQTPVDIANRALQSIGVERIDTALGFTENSRNASETASAYAKLRRAELEEKYWVFSIKKAILRAIDANTRKLSPAMWVTGTTYFKGSIVSDEDGYLWTSNIPSNLSNQPQNSTTWEPYYGPLSVSLYASTTAYSQDELVYTTPGDGTYRVYRSLQNNNSDVPITGTTWSATVTYKPNQVVTRSSVAYMSLIDFNLNQDPASAPALWSAATSYAINALVGASDGYIYKSLGNGNINHDPVSDGGVNWLNLNTLNPWTTVFVGGSGSLNWLLIGGTGFTAGVALSTLDPPLSLGPSTQETARYLYLLPATFLKVAPQDPKAGSNSYLGAPSGLLYNDWQFESGYLSSAEIGPIMFRFVADVIDVTHMKNLFCEGLALRMAMGVCLALTQSVEKLQEVSKEYRVFMGRAKLADAIEGGTIEPPQDDFIACRL